MCGLPMNTNNTAEDDESLLVTILDTANSSWLSAIDHICSFFNAFLLLNSRNRIAVIACSPATRLELNFERGNLICDLFLH